VTDIASRTHRALCCRKDDEAAPRLLHGLGARPPPMAQVLIRDG
jgi:hypothetical protein